MIRLFHCSANSSLFWSPRKLNAWRKSLRPGDPVSFKINGEKLTGDIVEFQSTHFIVVIHVSGYKCHLLLRNEVYPINHISQAPQGCDLGLTRPTAKRHVDHSGQEEPEPGTKNRSGLAWLFSFPEWRYLFPKPRRCNRSTNDTGGSPERG